VIAVACGTGVVALISYLWRRVKVGLQEARSMAARVAYPGMDERISAISSRSNAASS
jgi:hypothetical protein